ASGGTRIVVGACFRRSVMTFIPHPSRARRRGGDGRRGIADAGSSCSTTGRRTCSPMTPALDASAGREDRGGACDQGRGPHTLAGGEMPGAIVTGSELP